MFTTRWASLIGSLFVFLILVACGGGGGSGSSVTPIPPPQQGVIGYAPDYWQASGGSVWLYEGRDATSNTDYRNRATLGSPMSLDGLTLTRFDYTNALNEGVSPQYRTLGADGIRTYLEIAPTDPAYSYIELPAEIRAGTYRAFDTGNEPVQGGTMRITIDVTVAGLEALSVPGGDFASALHTTHTVTATITTTAGASSSGQSTIDYWYAKGIGVVKQLLTDPNYPAGSNTYSEELAGVITADVKAGVVGEFALLQNLGGGSSALTTGRPGVGSDGSGFLVVAYKTVNYRPSLVATYVEPNGAVRYSDLPIAQLGGDGPMSPDTSYGPVHVAWDGVRFWVIAEGAFSGMVGGVVRQRVAPDGALLDGPNGILLSAQGRQPALAIEGNTVLVVYAVYRTDPSSGWDLYTNAYKLDGSALAEGVRLDTTGLNAAMAAITGHAGEFLVSYEAGSPADVKAVRVGMSGAALDSTPISVTTGAGSQWGPEVAGWGGSRFVAVWQDGVSPGQTNIVAARMTAAGSLVDSGVMMCSQSTERFGTAAADGVRGTLLGWTVGSFYFSGQAPGIYGRLFKPDAELVWGTATRLGLLTQRDYGTRLMYPAAAASAEGFLVAWVYNVETGASTKSVRGVLVYPRYGT